MLIAAFVVGGMVGCALGMLLMSLLVAASRRDG